MKTSDIYPDFRKLRPWAERDRLFEGWCARQLNPEGDLSFSARHETRFEDDMASIVVAVASPGTVPFADLYILWDVELLEEVSRRGRDTGVEAAVRATQANMMKVAKQVCVQDEEQAIAIMRALHATWPGVRERFIEETKP